MLKKKTFHLHFKDYNITYTDPNTIYKEADFLSIHLHYTKVTAGMIGKEQFFMIKNTAVIVNTARGGIIEEATL